MTDIKAGGRCWLPSCDMGIIVTTRIDYLRQVAIDLEANTLASSVTGIDRILPEPAQAGIPKSIDVKEDK